MKTERELKVYGMSGYRYKTTPTIMLKGEWLKSFGFNIGRNIQVICGEGEIVIKAKKDPEPIEAPSRKQRGIKGHTPS